MAKKSRLAAKQPTILEFAVGNIDQETFDEVADKISLEMSRMLFRHQVDRCLITPGLKGAFMYVHVLKAEYFNEFKKIFDGERIGVGQVLRFTRGLNER